MDQSSQALSLSLQDRSFRHWFIWQISVPIHLLMTYIYVTHQTKSDLPCLPPIPCGTVKVASNSKRWFHSLSSGLWHWRITIFFNTASGTPFVSGLSIDCILKLWTDPWHITFISSTSVEVECWIGTIELVDSKIPYHQNFIFSWFIINFSVCL